MGNGRSNRSRRLPALVALLTLLVTLLPPLGAQAATAFSWSAVSTVKLGYDGGVYEPALDFETGRLGLESYQSDLAVSQKPGVGDGAAPVVTLTSYSGQLLDLGPVDFDQVPPLSGRYRNAVEGVVGHTYLYLGDTTIAKFKVLRQIPAESGFAIPTVFIKYAWGKVSLEEELPDASTYKDQPATGGSTGSGTTPGGTTGGSTGSGGGSTTGGGAVSGGGTLPGTGGGIGGIVLPTPGQVTHTLKVTPGSGVIVADGQASLVIRQAELVDGDVTFLAITLAKSLGAQYDWDEATGRMSFTLEGRHLVMWVNRADAYLNGTKLGAVKPMPSRGNTYQLVPMVYVATVLGANVTYDQTSGSITVTATLSGSTGKEAADAYFRQASEVLNKQDWSWGIGLLNRAIQADPTYAAAYYNRGFAYYKLGLNEFALADFQKVVALGATGQLGEMAANAVNVLKSQGGNTTGGGSTGGSTGGGSTTGGGASTVQVPAGLTAEELNARAVEFIDKAKDYDSAIAYTTRAIELKKDFLEAYTNRGIAYYWKGEYKKALADLEYAMSLNPREEVRRVVAWFIVEIDKLGITLDKPTSTPTPTPTPTPEPKPEPKPDPAPSTGSIVGKWRCMGFTGGTCPVGWYLEIKADGTFHMGAGDGYTGPYTLQGNKLTLSGPFAFLGAGTLKGGELTFYYDLGGYQMYAYFVKE